MTVRSYHADPSGFPISKREPSWRLDDGRLSQTIRPSGVGVWRMRRPLAAAPPFPNGRASQPSKHRFLGDRSKNVRHPGEEGPC
jgi:hypothetical protein